MSASQIGIAEFGCTGFQEWTGGRTVATMGSNVGSDSIPFQGWRRFKEAFAPEIVERAFRETPGVVSHIVDPFGGSGTTALAAQFLGVRPTTIEVNPFLADLVEAKLANYDLDKAASEFAAVVDRVFCSPEPSLAVFQGAPKTFVEPGVDGRYIFSVATAARLLMYRHAIEEVSDCNIRRLFRVLLGSITVRASNVTVSGKGRRYRSGWLQKPVMPETVDALFKEAVLTALYDLRRFIARPCRRYRVLRGDARKLTSAVGPFDLAVFSPPYPNSFDYTDVYNIELWTVGYLDGAAANTRLRKATLRSHVQIARDMRADANCSPTLTRVVNGLNAVSGALWNRHIPAMIAAYMSDMGRVLTSLARNLRPSGRIYMVVGDSRYATVDVPVAAILTEIAPSIGYKVLEIEPFRSMRVSPQQGGRPELAETLVILER